MKRLFKMVIKKTPLYYPLKNLLIKKMQIGKFFRQERELIEWKRNGRPVPPPHIVKQRALKSLADLFGLKILVETGTYYGDMVEAMAGSFDYIYSIELSNELYEKAKKKFQGNTKVELIHGDSGTELGKLINRIEEPALFWLDGHYSAGVTARGNKDTPIYEELAHICNAPDNGHVIIIDDACRFGADPAYPSLEDLSEFIFSRRPNCSIAVEDDSIRITPNKVIR